MVPICDILIILLCGITKVNLYLTICNQDTSISSQCMKVISMLYSLMVNEEIRLTKKLTLPILQME
ncbi:unnamed protein product [Moneuplotes crassus]|uniref:Uncharacterized protein n=1 Tax=Euplotes crassus TaxID=5936 RepID=A0AAD1UQB1_EUPCR|nr:unnamed protein product [Moneuplotes crassus]